MKTLFVQLSIWLPAGIVFLFLSLQRALAGATAHSLNPDGICYSLCAQRAAEGNLAESIPAIWMPLPAWLAAPLVFAGLAPHHAVAAVSLLATLATILLVSSAVAGSLWFSEDHVPTSGDGAIWAGIATGIVFSTDPLLLHFSVVALSDALYMFLSLATLLSVWHYYHTLKSTSGIHRRPFVIWCVLGPAMLLTRLPGVPLAALLLALLIWEYRGRRIGGAHLLAYAGCCGAVLLSLSFFYHSRLGIWTPSGHFLIQKFDIYYDFIAPNPEAYTRLYDGKNTVVGDFEYLRAGDSIPSTPEISPRLWLQYRLTFTQDLSLGLATLVSLPVTIIAAIGAWSLLQYRSSSVLALLLGLGFASVCAILVHCYVKRFLLPLLPVVYLLFGFGLRAVAIEWRYGLSVTQRSVTTKPRFRRVGLLVVLCVIIFSAVLLNLLFGFVSSNILQFKHGIPRHEKSAGEWIYESFGPGRSVMTSWQNYRSAVESRGRWRPVPSCPAQQALNYIHNKEVEFVILPAIDSSSELTALGRELEQVTSAERVHEDNSEIVFRIKLTGPTK